MDSSSNKAEKYPHKTFFVNSSGEINIIFVFGALFFAMDNIFSKPFLISNSFVLYTLYKKFKSDVPAIGMGLYLNNILNAMEKEVND